MQNKKRRNPPVFVRVLSNLVAEVRLNLSQIILFIRNFNFYIKSKSSAFTEDFEIPFQSQKLSSDRIENFSGTPDLSSLSHQSAVGVVDS